MLTELLGKGGKVCQPARNGGIRCPLIVRPTSEDVITGHLFGTLRAISPRWWLPDLLSSAIPGRPLRRQIFRRLKITLWENRPKYPRELLPWDEGSTQVDAVIRYENPPTTVYVEMKYRADLSPKTAGGEGVNGFPSDQLIRNIRVGLLECGWFRQSDLFETQPRQFFTVLITPTRGHRLVRRYQEAEQLRAAIPHSDRLRKLPTAPFVGELAYRDIVGILQSNRRWLTRPERIMAEDLADYLALKSQAFNDPSANRQGHLPLED